MTENVDAEVSASGFTREMEDTLREEVYTVMKTNVELKMFPESILLVTKKHFVNNNFSCDPVLCSEFSWIELAFKAAKKFSLIKIGSLHY